MWRPRRTLPSARATGAGVRSGLTPEQMRRVSDGPACPDRGGYKCRFGELRVAGASIARGLGMQFNAVWALCRQRDRDGNQLLLLRAQCALFEHRLVKRPEAFHRVGCVFVQFLESSKMLHIEHEILQ